MTYRKRTKPTKKPQLEKKLAAYTLAGAAALAMPGAAKATTIIYVPNVNQTVNQTGSYNFNLSGIASDDITITAHSVGYPGPSSANEIDATTVSGAATVDDPTSSLVSALAFGALIDPTVSASFGSGGKMIGIDPTISVFSGGDWPTNGNDAFLGFYFTSGGGKHAGWADISTTANGTTSSFTINRYAYQSVVNTSIDAGDTGVPEPSTMVLIALGGAGLIALRRRRSANA